MDLTTRLRLQGFPKVTKNNYSPTSPITSDYNCIAWAAEEDDKWWEPDVYGMYHWPAGAKREYSLDAYIEAYESVGYVICADGAIEKGFKKIAIYVNPLTYIPTHAARQLPNGKWTSKLGQNIDISHDDTGVLEGPAYGLVARYMKQSLV